MRTTSVRIFASSLHLAKELNINAGSSPMIKTPLSPINVPPTSPVVTEPTPAVSPRHSSESPISVKHEISVESPIVKSTIGQFPFTLLSNSQLTVNQTPPHYNRPNLQAYRNRTWKRISPLLTLPFLPRFSFHHRL